MSIRIISTTILFFLVFGHAFAAGPKLSLEKTLVLPDSWKVLNIENEVIPLPKLPMLPGKTWRDWMVPGALGLAVGSGKQTYTKDIIIVNIRESDIIATTECYDEKGRKTFRKEVTLKERDSTSLRFKGIKRHFSWCRVSSEDPIMVYIIEQVWEQNIVHRIDEGSDGNKSTSVTGQARAYNSIILAYPYPVE